MPNVKLISQFINVIATNNDLLMDELNVIYFAPKLWLYVMIWLPRTTDNSTHFAQSLEIRGIESRLYSVFVTVQLCLCKCVRGVGGGGGVRLISLESELFFSNCLP